MIKKPYNAGLNKSKKSKIAYSKNANFKPQKTESTTFRFRAKKCFLTYKGTTSSGQYLTKQSLRDFLLSNPGDMANKPDGYAICMQAYTSGQPHLHAILCYPRLKDVKDPSFYDYMGIHPHISPIKNYKASLDYIQKTDPYPLTNLNICREIVLTKAKNSSDLFTLLQQEMYKNPHSFDVYDYCRTHNLYQSIFHTNISKVVNLLKHEQQAHCNYLLRNKPKYRYISMDLISSVLNSDELAIYNSWNGYSTIVKYLNTIITYGCNRPQKSMNLLITGPTNAGKSALVWQRNPLPGRTSIHTHCSVYPMGMRNWFPKYRSEVYDCIYWNEANLSSYSYDLILKLLDGSPVDLPTHGSYATKLDNPLVIMTSNLTIRQLIKYKFGYSPSLQTKAIQNLATRIENVIIPQNYNLFLLQKLLIPPSSPSQ